MSGSCVDHELPYMVGNTCTKNNGGYKVRYISSSTSIIIVSYIALYLGNC